MENFAISKNDKELIDYYASVIVLNAGGTINMEGKRGKMPANKVRNILLKLNDTLENKYGINVKYENVFERPPDSSNIGENEWEELFKKIKFIINKKLEIYQELKKKGVLYEKGGIVVAHGTDTMELTSLVISLEIKLFKNILPIVFTGSYSTIGEKGSDALNNLKKAVIISKEKFNRKSNLPPGVYVMIGKDIHLASRLTKVYTEPDSNGKYFFSFPAPIGQITGDNLSINFNYLNSLQFSDAKLENYSNNRSLKTVGIVEHIILDKFSKCEIINDFLARFHFYKSQNSYKKRRVGLIVQGNFIKNPNIECFMKTLRDIENNGIPVFFGSKEVYEYICNQNRKSPLKLTGLIDKSMSHSKARTKLSWLLSFEDIPTKNIVSLMHKNIAGELFNVSELPEWINYETYPDQIDGVEIVVIYPGINPKVIEDAVERLKISEKHRKRLYLFGFGDGHVPVVNKPIKDIIRTFLSDKCQISGPDFDNQNSINEILEELASYIMKDDNARSNCKNYLFNYEIKKNKLLHAVNVEKIRSINRSIKNEKIFIRESECFNKNSTKLFLLEDLISEYLNRIEEDINKSIDKDYTFSFKDKNKLKDYIIKSLAVKFRYSKFIEKENPVFTTDKKQEIFEYILKKYPILVARRIIKDALMISSPILNILGETVDNGIEVYIKSQAVRAKTDNSKYEVGIMLKCVGVNSDISQGLIADYFLPSR